MAKKEVSPEKRLLEIIEKQGADGTACSPLSEGGKYFSPTALRARVAFFKDKFKRANWKKLKLSVNLETVNILLQLLIITAVISLGISIKIESEALGKGKNLVVTAAQTEVEANAVADIASLLKSKDYYINKVAERNLFSIKEEEKEAEAVDFKKEEKEQENAALVKLKEITKDLKLVGISWSEDPDAIIEDLFLKKTYFVKKGFKIEGIIVRDIQRDKVILRYEGEEVELR
ncbi:MAG: hypothetical protein HY810_01710 [Candidatus Omnitrophica bacterium]|nr:hypothetical protein [Candidatus Omnitrophota bacterium]